MYYVAIDIGCIECGEETNVLGIFTDKERAGKTCADHRERQEKEWHGQHGFFVEEIAEINKVYTVEY